MCCQPGLFCLGLSACLFCLCMYKMNYRQSFKTRMRFICHDRQNCNINRLSKSHRQWIDSVCIRRSSCTKRALYARFEFPFLSSSLSFSRILWFDSGRTRPTWRNEMEKGLHETKDNTIYSNEWINVSWTCCSMYNTLFESNLLK